MFAHRTCVPEYAAADAIAPGKQPGLLPAQKRGICIANAKSSQSCPIKGYWSLLHVNRPFSLERFEKIWAELKQAQG